MLWSVRRGQTIAHTSDVVSLVAATAVLVDGPAVVSPVPVAATVIVADDLAFVLSVPVAAIAATAVAGMPASLVPPGTIAASEPVWSWAASGVQQ